MKHLGFTQVGGDIGGSAAHAFIKARCDIGDAFIDISALRWWQVWQVWKRDLDQGANTQKAMLFGFTHRPSSFLIRAFTAGRLVA
ncbi:MAG: hypothetical protein ACYC67_10405 [Prosthecobacter sp.]